jgi:hypothetical protein
MNPFPHITVMTLVPVIGAILIAVLPGRDAAPSASVANPWPVVSASSHRSLPF